jgi:phosphoribosylanthranilate isomerase
MRDAQNISELMELSPDYVGFIFCAKSPRDVGDDFPFADFQQVTPPSKKVMVVVNESVDFILSKLEQFPFDAVQLHGTESPAFAQELKEKGKVEVWKVFSVDSDFDFDKTLPYEDIADFFLFDTKGKEHGGNGIAFDWNVLDRYNGQTPFLLSGGIGPENIADASNIRHPKLYGIDVNSRFEIEPGLKNIEKLKTILI